MKEVLVWIKEPLLPASAPKPKSNAFSNVKKHMDNWITNDISLSKIPTNNWTVHEWLYFINNLPKSINLKQLNSLDQAYQLTQSSNNEIAHAWLLLNIKKSNPVINQRLETYMISIGRRKLIVPLYRALLEDPNNLKFTKMIYAKARPGYHPLAQGTIDALFDKVK